MIQSRENKIQNTYILLSLHTLYFYFSYFLTSTMYEIDYWFLIISYGYIKIIITSEWADVKFKKTNSNNILLNQWNKQMGCKYIYRYFCKINLRTYIII